MAAPSGRDISIVPVDSLSDSAKFGYSHCIRAGSLVFVAGQLGVGGAGDSNDFASQARRALDKVCSAVEAAGGSRASIVALTIYITNIADGRAFAALRKEYFRDRFPTSTLVGISALMLPEATVEIQAVAVV
ncbi:MAG: RidA family protein [Burkholderiales bacterium]|nr:RidA family protein [Burkholderiales bacterium]